MQGGVCTQDKDPDLFCSFFSSLPAVDNLDIGHTWCLPFFSMRSRELLFSFWHVKMIHGNDGCVRRKEEWKDEVRAAVDQEEAMTPQSRLS